LKKVLDTHMEEKITIMKDEVRRVTRELSKGLGQLQPS
jgi:hypothetical protein